MARIIQRQEDIAAAAAADEPEAYIIALPGFQRSKALMKLSISASTLLRHTLAKKFPDGLVPIKVFCDSFDYKRSVAGCLATLVLGSDNEV